MKKTHKNIFYSIGAFTIAMGILALSCNMNKTSGSMAFAQESQSQTQSAQTKPIPTDSLAVTQSLQNTFRSISANVLPSVVEIDVTETRKVPVNNFFKGFPFFGMPETEEGTKEYEETGLGSGVIVKRTGNTIYALTNFHVAGKASKIKVKLNDEREFEGKLVGGDERIDIALVSFESNDQSIVISKLGDSDVVQQGDIVLALGSPLGYFASVTQGIVSATGRSGRQIGSISDFIQTDAAINQGNSGGPLVNIYGEVIGINTWIASRSGGSQGLGFSIPINNIKTAIDQFISNGKIAYGWLGVSLVEVTDEYKTELGIDKNQPGALACQVFLGSPAIKSGIQPGDYIIELDGKEIKSVDQLVRQISGIRAGKTAKFKILRGKEKKEITVKIEERSEEITSDNLKLWPGFIASLLNDDSRKKLNIENKKIQGVVVSGVQEKTPAAALRLQNGDIITAVNDKPVKNIAEFYKELDTTNKKEFWFDVYNEGHTTTTNKFKISK